MNVTKKKETTIPWMGQWPFNSKKKKKKQRKKTKQKTTNNQKPRESIAREWDRQFLTNSGRSKKTLTNRFSSYCVNVHQAPTRARDLQLDWRRRLQRVISICTSTNSRHGNLQTRKQAAFNVGDSGKNRNDRRIGLVLVPCACIGMARVRKRCKKKKARQEILPFSPALPICTHCLWIFFKFLVGFFRIANKT